MKLKSCPFCGNREIETAYNEYGSYEIFCTDCWAKIFDSMKEYAIEKWNTRNINQEKITKEFADKLVGFIAIGDDLKGTGTKELWEEQGFIED